jgi:hypothetical protein
MLNEPLLSSVGNLGLMNNADHVMNSNFEYTAKLLKHFKMNNAARAAPKAPRSLDVVTCQKLWAKAKERTASH